MAEKLPRINADRLIKIVVEIERVKVPKSFEDLCMKVAQHNWAAENDLDSNIIGLLIKEHQIPTKTLEETPKSPPAPAPKKETPKSPPPAPAKETPKPPPAPAPAKETPKPPPAPAPAKETPKPAPPKEAPKPPSPAPAPLVKEVPPPKPAASVDGPKEEEDQDEDDRSEVKTYDEGGRGRKQCPKCRKYVGNRASVCGCGNQFTEGGGGVVVAHSRLPRELQEAEARASAASHRYGCSNLLFTPAGKPPVALKSNKLEDVEEWAEEVRRIRRNQDRHFVTLGALMYYVCAYYRDMDGVMARLRQIYPNE